MRAEHERHAAAMQAIGERKAEQREALGEYPAVENIESRAVAA